MDPVTIASLISAASAMVGTGASVGGTAATNKKQIAYAKRENELQRNFAREQARTAYERQMSFWNAENQYNSPSSQMLRYIQAGLNPNLIYSDGQSLSPVPAVATVGNSTSHVPQLSNPLSTENLSAARLAEAQIRNLNADSDKKDADANLSYKQAWNIGQLTPVQVDLIRAQVDNLQQQFQSNEFTTLIEQLKMDYYNDPDSYWTFVNEYGEEVSTDFRSLVMDNAVKSLYASNVEYQKAIELFLSEVGIAKETKHNLELQNQDLQEFVNVCKDIYMAQQMDAQMAIVLSDGNKEFWQMFDGKSEAVKMIAGFLKIIAQGFMSRYSASGRPSGGVTINNRVSLPKNGKKK